MVGKLKVLDLFSGIGGFSLGLERTGGFETVAFCEIDPFCRQVLAKHWPTVRQYDDVRTLTADALERDGIAVDVICGGFPCQDISESNVGGAGLDGERSGLWTEYARIVREFRPKYVLVENVSNLLGRGFGRVLGDLATAGYDAFWRVLPASELGAPHERERLWIIAHPTSLERRSHSSSPSDLAREHALSQWAQGAGGLEEQTQTPWGEAWPAFVDRLSLLDDGLSIPVDEFNGYANAVIPQIPELIGRAILESERAAA